MILIYFIIIYFSDVKAENTSANATADAKNKIKVECVPRVLEEDEVFNFFFLNTIINFLFLKMSSYFNLCWLIIWLGYFRLID